MRQEQEAGPERGVGSFPAAAQEQEQEAGAGSRSGAGAPGTKAIVGVFPHHLLLSPAPASCLLLLDLQARDVSSNGGSDWKPLSRPAT